MKKSKILIPALGILVLSTAASITGTVAWFSVNNSVTVDGMAVTTQVSGNLQIAKVNQEANFGSKATMGTDASLLEPTSTVDALSYFYTTDAKADGSKEHGLTGEGAIAYKAYANTSAGNATFNEDYKTTDAVGYIDYAFYLKAVNPSDADNVIRMTKCNLLYNGAAITEKAWRVAVFSQDAQKNTEQSTAVASGDLVTILTPASAAYFDNTAVSSTTAKTAVSAKKDQPALVLEDIDNSDPFYCKITVRVWLEGEDTTCNNETYAKLTENWSLDLEFQLVDPNATPAPAAAVTGIGSSNA